MGRKYNREELDKKADKELEILFEKAKEGKIKECFESLPCLKAMEKATLDYFFHKNKRELGLEK